MVIDDEEAVRELLRDVLAQEGHEVVVAPDGRSGSALYRERPCDLVITDIFMPEQEGLETIRELRREFPGVKIIAISGAAGQGFDALYAARKLGARRTLTKPFDLEAFVGAVKEVLEE